MSTLVDSWAEEILSPLRAQQLMRALEPLEGPVGARVRIGNQELISFSSNDYLGLAAHPAVMEAAREAITRHGVGTGASRLVVGDTRAHQSLERALEAFEGVPCVRLFSSGYAANVGVLGALFGPGDVLFSDTLNHASLVDGCRLSRAEVVVYPHRDVEALEALLRSRPGRRRAIVTDSVFSMDGDRAPMRALRSLADQHGLALVVDEAHATGVLGATGRGLCELEGVRADVHVGTLSKSLGSAGGYVAGSAALGQVLLQRARSLVFSTAMPAAWCAAAETALQLMTLSPARRVLGDRIAQLAEGLQVEPSAAVFSVVLGSPERALTVSHALRERGLLVKAIRPPTVPEGTSRLRVAVTAAHRPSDVERLIEGLRQLGAMPTAPVGHEVEVRAHEHR